MEHSCVLRRKENARARKHDLGIEDHGLLFLYGGFDFAGGTVQGWGIEPDLRFIRALLDVFGARRLDEIDGRACVVTHCNSRIHYVEPLLPNEGTAFDVDAWAQSFEAAA